MSVCNPSYSDYCEATCSICGEHNWPWFMDGGVCADCLGVNPLVLKEAFIAEEKKA